MSKHSLISYIASSLDWKICRRSLSWHNADNWILKTYFKRRLDVTNKILNNLQILIKLDCWSALPCRQTWACPSQLWLALVQLWWNLTCFLT